MDQRNFVESVSISNNFANWNFLQLQEFLSSTVEAELQDLRKNFGTAGRVNDRRENKDIVAITFIQWIAVINLILEILLLYDFLQN